LLLLVLAPGALVAAPAPGVAEARTIAVLEQWLLHDSAQVRVSAVVQLGHMDQPETIPLLVQMLRDDAASVREAAVDALRRIGQREIRLLEQGLRDADVKVRIAGVADLRRADRIEEIAPLELAFRDDAVEVRHAVVDALGRLDRVETIPLLMQMLGDDAAGGRAAAVVALDRVGGPQANALIAQALDDEHPGVRTLAASALMHRAVPLSSWLEALDSQDPAVRRSAFTAAAKQRRLRSPAVAEALRQELERQGTPALVNLLTDLRTPRLHDDLIDALAALGPPAVSFLAEALKEPSDGIRLDALEALGEIGNDEAVAVLAQALDRASSTVQRAAAEALSRIDSSAALRALARALANDRLDIRETARARLGEVEASRAISALAAVLDDEDRSVHRAAIDALGSLGPAAVPALAQALDNADAGVRGLAATALSKVADPVVIPVLIQAIEDSDLGVRRSAVEGLAGRADPAVIPALIQAIEDSDPGVRQRAVQGLARRDGPAVIPVLIGALEDGDSYVRQLAAAPLGDRRVISAAPALVASLHTTGPAAAKALVKIGPPAVPALAAALEADNLGAGRERALVTLAEIGSTEAISALQRTLDHRITAQTVAKLMAIDDPQVRLITIDATAKTWDTWLWWASFRSRLNAKEVAIMRSKPGYWMVLPLTPFLLAIAALVLKTLAGPAARWTQRSALLFFGAAVSLPISWLVMELLTRYTVDTAVFAGLTGISLVIVCFIPTGTAKTLPREATVNPWGWRAIWIAMAFLLASGIWPAPVLPEHMPAFDAPAAVERMSDSLVVCGLVVAGWVLFGALARPRVKRGQVCRRDFHRVLADPKLPWPVRWSRGVLYEEVPKRHQRLQDYLTCIHCGGNDTIIAHRRIGVIGALPGTPDTDDERRLLLYDPATGRAISADIDQLELHPPPPGVPFEWDHAVNAIVNALTEDHRRSHPLKDIPVFSHAGLTLPENARRVLTAHLGPVSVPADGQRTKALATP
jgi:HEAT repeat protein